MRTFHFSDAKSHKFWNIEVSGTSFTVTYGKVGSAGQTQTKTFASAEKAQAEADKLIREKVKKGYLETTAKEAVSQAEAFERALSADPDDVAGWCAYADYLSEHGDPRGEFMQVQIALEDERRPAAEREGLKKREAELLKKHERDWLGPIAPFLLDPKPPRYEWRTETITFRFRRGWLSELEIPRLGVEFTRALLRCVEARFLQKLHIHTSAYEFAEGDPNASQYADSSYVPGPDIDEAAPRDEVAMYLLAKFPYFASVRVLHLGNPVTDTFDDSDQCHTSGGMAYHYLKQMPHVEQIYLLAHGVDAAKIFAMPMPRLRLLHYYHGKRYPLDKLAANPSLTNLTTLLCHPHGLEFDDEESGAYIRLAHLRAICRSPHLNALTNLRLRLTDFGDKGANELVESGLLKRLKVLDLQGGCITDKGAKLLADCPDLKNLSFLNLRSNALTDAGVKALTATGVKADVSSQHSATSGEFAEGEEVPEYLFDGDIE
jgi:uncharacterized protein (TIGR02996 family)